MQAAVFTHSTNPEIREPGPLPGMQQAQANNVQIFVRSIFNRNYPIHIGLNQTVRDLKAQVCHVVRVMPNPLVLTFMGESLEDDRTLQTYGIVAESTIHIGVCWRANTYSQSFRVLRTCPGWRKSSSVNQDR